MGTAERIENQIEQSFHFYSSIGLAGNSAIIDSFTFAKRFKVADIRVHFSVIPISVNALLVYVSSVLGSEFNVKLVSQAISTAQDIFIHFSSPLQFNSDDALKFSSASVIVANKCGIEVFGWAVLG